VTWYVVRWATSSGPRWAAVPFAGYLEEDPGFRHGPFPDQEEAEEFLRAWSIVEAVMSA
jgi:hypothetical protein